MASEQIHFETVEENLFVVSIVEALSSNGYNLPINMTEIASVHALKEQSDALGKRDSIHIDASFSNLDELNEAFTNYSLMDPKDFTKAISVSGAGTYVPEENCGIIGVHILVDGAHKFLISNHFAQAPKLEKVEKEVDRGLFEAILDYSSTLRPDADGSIWNWLSSQLKYYLREMAKLTASTYWSFVDLVCKICPDKWLLTVSNLLDKIGWGMFNHGKYEPDPEKVTKEGGGLYIPRTWSVNIKEKEFAWKTYSKDEYVTESMTFASNLFGQGIVTMFKFNGTCYTTGHCGGGGEIDVSKELMRLDTKLHADAYMVAENKHLIDLSLLGKNLADGTYICRETETIEISKDIISSSPHGIMFYTNLKGGDSGCPCVKIELGHVSLVGTFGWSAIVKDKNTSVGLVFTNDIITPERMKMSSVCREIAAKMSEKDIITVSGKCGSGKSTDLIAALFQVTKRQIIICQPLKANVVGLFKYMRGKYPSIKFGALCSDLKSGDFDSCDIVYCTRHYLFEHKASAICKHIIIVDECHMVDNFLYGIRQKYTQRLELSATVKEWDFSIGDTKYPVAEVPAKYKNAIDEAERWLKQGKRVLVFLPTIKKCIAGVERIKQKGYKGTTFTSETAGKYMLDNMSEHVQCTFATNSAENGITGNFDVVIDSQEQYSYCGDWTKPEKISLQKHAAGWSSCEQRKGRVGRTKPGFYVAIETDAEPIEPLDIGLMYYHWKNSIDFKGVVNRGKLTVWAFLLINYSLISPKIVTDYRVIWMDDDGLTLGRQDFSNTLLRAFINNSGVTVIEGDFDVQEKNWEELLSKRCTDKEFIAAVIDNSYYGYLSRTIKSGLGMRSDPYVQKDFVIYGIMITKVSFDKEDIIVGLRRVGSEKLSNMLEMLFLLGREVTLRFSEIKYNWMGMRVSFNVKVQLPGGAWNPLNLYTNSIGLNIDKNISEIMESGLGERSYSVFERIDLGESIFLAGSSPSWKETILSFFKGFKDIFNGIAPMGYIRRVLIWSEENFAYIVGAATTGEAFTLLWDRFLVWVRNPSALVNGLAFPVLICIGMYIIWKLIKKFFIRKKSIEDKYNEFVRKLDGEERKKLYTDYGLQVRSARDLAVMPVSSVFGYISGDILYSLGKNFRSTESKGNPSSQLIDLCQWGLLGLGAFVTTKYFGIAVAAKIVGSFALSYLLRRREIEVALQNKQVIQPSLSSRLWMLATVATLSSLKPLLAVPLSVFFGLWKFGMAPGAFMVMIPQIVRGFASKDKVVLLYALWLLSLLGDVNFDYLSNWFFTENALEERSATEVDMSKGRNTFVIAFLKKLYMWILSRVKVRTDKFIESVKKNHPSTYATINSWEFFSRLQGKYCTLPPLEAPKPNEMVGDAMVEGRLSTANRVPAGIGARHPIIMSLMPYRDGDKALDLQELYGVDDMIFPKSSDLAMEAMKIARKDIPHRELDREQQNHFGWATWHMINMFAEEIDFIYDLDYAGQFINRKSTQGFMKEIDEKKERLGFFFDNYPDKTIQRFIDVMEDKPTEKVWTVFYKHEKIPRNTKLIETSIGTFEGTIPRGITCSPPTYRINDTIVFRPIHERIVAKNRWIRLDSSPAEVARVLIYELENRKDPVIFTCDQSKLDGHVSVDHAKFEMIFMSHFYSDSKALKWLSSHYKDLIYRAECLPDGRVYRINMTRPSGDLTTSDGNSFIVTCLMLIIFRFYLGLSWNVIDKCIFLSVTGDDVVSIAERILFDKLNDKEGLINFVAKYGFEIKDEGKPFLFTEFGVDKATYLSHYPKKLSITVDGNDVSVPVLDRDLRVAFSKFFVVDKDKYDIDPQGLSNMFSTCVSYLCVLFHNHELATYMRIVLSCIPVQYHVFNVDDPEKRFRHRLGKFVDEIPSDISNKIGPDFFLSLYGVKGNLLPGVMKMEGPGLKLLGGIQKARDYISKRLERGDLTFKNYHKMKW